MHPQFIIPQLTSRCSQRVTLDLWYNIPLIATANTQVYSMSTISIFSKVQVLSAAADNIQKHLLKHILQARATTGWPEDRENFIASIQSARTKRGNTTFNQFSIAAKTIGSFSAYSQVPESPIPPSSGYPTSLGCLLSASATKTFKPGGYTIFNEKSANLYNHLIQ